MSTLSHVLYRLPSIRFWVWICRFYLEICENFDRVSGKLMNDSEISSISLMKNGASNYFRDTQCKQLTSKCHSFAPFAQFVHHISMDAGCCCCFFVYNLHSHISLVWDMHCCLWVSFHKLHRVSMLVAGAHTFVHLMSVPVMINHNSKSRMSLFWINQCEQRVYDCELCRLCAKMVLCYTGAHLILLTWHTHSLTCNHFHDAIDCVCVCAL